MITGMVTHSEGRIRLKVKETQGHEEEVEAVVDTGFTDWLSLPSSVIAALGLRWRSLDRAILADGSECLFDVCWANVVWDGKPRRVPVDEADTDPLVGMKLMKGYELKMQNRYRGKVTIKRMPRT
jgi:clan AA aspartic protease